MENGVPVGEARRGGRDGGEDISHGDELGGAVVVVLVLGVIGVVGFESILAAEREVAEAEVGLSELEKLGRC